MECNQIEFMFFRWSQSHPEGRSTRPHCQGIYNCFHLMDPLAARLEPLLSARFANTRPVTVPRYFVAPNAINYSLELQFSMQTISQYDTFIVIDQLFRFVNEMSSSNVPCILQIV